MDTLARWRGTLAVLNQRTGDGRMLRSLRWPDLPVPLRWAKEDQGAHDGAVLVGQIDRVDVVDDEVLGWGFIDTATDEGSELMSRMATHGSLGVSLDLDDTDFEVWTRADKLEAEEALWDTLWSDDASSEDVQQAVDEHAEAMGTGGEETSEEGERYVVSYRHEADEELFVFTDALVRAATVVDVPAFVSAQIEADSDTEGGTEPSAEDRGWRSALVASAVPLAPPREWFDNPHLTGPTPMTVTDEGHVYGHIALWGTCHIGSVPGVCTEPPHDETDYARYRGGVVRCSDGSDVPVGVLSMGGDHAGKGLSAFEASMHYSKTSMAVAYLSAGEDSTGIWVSGALKAGTTPEQVQELRASRLSGDWREVWTATGWTVMMIATLAVNVPGFDIPRLSGSVRSGRTYSLVASAGLIGVDDGHGGREVFTPSQVATLRALADRAASDDETTRRLTAAALRRQVLRGESLELVRRTASMIGVS